LPLILCFLALHQSKGKGWRIVSGAILLWLVFLGPKGKGWHCLLEAEETRRYKSMPEKGEVIGVFGSIQLSDTDLGAKAPKDVKIQGIWYAQLHS
jgi:hypothetical protein